MKFLGSTPRRMTKDNLFLLIGDKGCTTEQQLANGIGPEIAINHQELSAMVNFDALSKYIINAKGDAKVSSLYEGYSVATFIAKGKFSDYPNMSMSFDEFMDFYSSMDQFNLTYHQFSATKNRHETHFSIAEIMSMIKVSHYSPDVAYGLKDKIRELIAQYKKVKRLVILANHGFHDILLRTLDNYYFMPGYQYYCFELGSLLYELGQFELSLKCLDEQLFYTPNHIDSEYNKGICFLSLHRYNDAIKQFNTVKKIKKNYLDTEKLLEFAKSKI